MAGSSEPGFAAKRISGALASRVRQSDRWHDVIYYLSGHTHLIRRGGVTKVVKGPGSQLDTGLMDWCRNTLAGKLTAGKPGALFTPVNMSDDSWLVAESMGELFGKLYTQRGFSSVISEAVADALNFGMVALRAEWDPRGSVTYIADDGSEVTVEGSPGITAYAPWDFVCNPEAKTPPQMTWCAFRKRLNFEDAVEWFKGNGVKISRSEVERMSQLGSSVFNVYTDPGPFTGMLSEGTERHVIIWDYEELPSSRHRDGRRVVVVGDEEVATFPLTDRRLSAWVVRDGTGGGMYPRGRSSLCLDTLRDLEARETVSSQADRVHGKPLWIVAEGTLPGLGSIGPLTSIVSWNHNRGPKPIREQPLGSAPGSLEERQAKRAAVMEIFTINEISRGDTKRLESGRALGAAVEIERSNNGLLIVSIDEAVMGLAMDVVSSWVRKMSADVTSSVLGLSNEVARRVHSSSASEYQVNVSPGAMIVPARDQVRQEALELAQAQIITPDEARSLLRHHIPGDTVSVRADRSAANHENAIFLDLESEEWKRVEVSFYEDHKTHIDVHKRVLNDPDKKLELGEDRVRALQFHLAKHYAERDSQAQGQPTYQHLLQDQNLMGEMMPMGGQEQGGEMGGFSGGSPQLNGAGPIGFEAEGVQ